ncbi:hypothetical protein [Cohnella sp. REN36]|uniref:hypothetical protein n=1 Tax=Cohnella sp. REN36 TaxID=2887347 RepID=UPI001D132DB1|nr:hypothetical protein [Cohnella sp. REN36]MCC3372837.1 hypothetical protein [Cohnella sp. REN36]
MRRLHGIEMRLPEGKLPGYYAQIVKGIAERTVLFDRRKELLVLDDPASVPGVTDLLAHYRVPADPVPLLLLPAAGVRPGPDYADYAIETSEGRVYLDLGQAALFRLARQGPAAEPAPALLQLDEHLIVSMAGDDGDEWHALPRPLTELADRVARIYGCEAVWLAD